MEVRGAPRSLDGRDWALSLSSSYPPRPPTRWAWVCLAFISPNPATTSKPKCEFHEVRDSVLSSAGSPVPGPMPRANKSMRNE